MPIKIVEKPLQNLKQVVNGEEIRAVVAATVVLIKKIKKQQPQKKDWQVLLDSGSDGDLIFITKKGSKEHSTQKEVRSRKLGNF